MSEVHAQRTANHLPVYQLSQTRVSRTLIEHHELLFDSSTYIFQMLLLQQWCACAAWRQDFPHSKHGDACWVQIFQAANHLLHSGMTHQSTRDCSRVDHASPQAESRPHSALLCWCATAIKGEPGLRLTLLDYTSFRLCARLYGLAGLLGSSGSTQAQHT